MPTLTGSFTRLDIADALRVELDGTTVRVLCADGSAALRASALAADVARLERALCDAAARRQQLISDLGVVTRERDGLRARLDGQAAHGAAGEGVDRSVWVRRSDVRALCDREARELRGAGRYDAAYSVARVSKLVSEGADLRSEHVEGGEQQGVEGGEGHGGASVATARGAVESPR